MKGRLASADRQRLADFLGGAGRPPNTLQYQELQGFLFAVVTAPGMIPASDWFRVIFGGSDVVYEDEEEGEAIAGAIMALYDEAVTLSRSGGLPDDCTVYRASLHNIGRDAPLGQWAHGFLIGHEWTEELWDFLRLDETQEETWTKPAAFLRIFCDPAASREAFERILASVQQAAPKPIPEDCKEPLCALLIQEYLEELPPALAAYAELGRALTRTRAAGGSLHAWE